MAKEIVLYNTNIDVHDYEPGDCEELEKSLSTWDSTYYRYNPLGISYNKETKVMTIPRGIDVSYLKSKLKCPVRTCTEYNDYDKIKIKLKTEPRNDIQVKSIGFLTGEGNFKYTRDYSQLSLNLDTGDGKTYCVIASLCILKCKAIIITHTENVKEQWIKSLNKFTNIDMRRVCNVHGSRILEELESDEDLVRGHDIFLLNHGTLQQYAKKHGWETINALFRSLKVGIKVYDEAHKHFKSILNVDLHTNVYKTFYITATFERTDISEDKLFKLCFKNIAKFGLETRGDKRKHIKYVAVMFDSKPNMEDKMSIRGPKGFDRNAYIDYEIEKGVIFDVIKYVMDTFQKIDGKCMILSSKISSSEDIAEKVKEWYPDKSLSIFHSKISKEEKAKVREADVISTTPQSAGTGTDIPGLRYNIMCEPYNANITAQQVCGRLREIPGQYTYHIELIDVGFEKVKSMYKKRLPVFKQKCLSVSKVDY